MAKTIITMSCGHDEEHNICGPYKSRAGKAEWLAANRVCADCYRKRQAEERGAELARRESARAEAAKSAEAEGLPELTGSDKQVAWALTIRAELLARIDRAIGINRANEPADAKVTLDEMRAAIVGRADAGWWIDRRKADAVTIMREVGRELVGAK